MAYKDRIDLYKAIEKHREGRSLIVYVTSKRNGIAAEMSTDALPYIIQQLDALPDDAKGLDFLIVSYGGDPMVAWRIMTLIRQRLDDEKATITVMIPQSAYSAATLLAFGANEIIMHPNGHLGPVDMQIIRRTERGATSFSTEDISAFLEFVRDNLKITDQEHIRTLFEATCREVGTLGIGFTARSSKLAVDLGERLLQWHMKDDESSVKLRTIVENMSRKFQAHSYPVNRKEAIDIGLPVNKDRDKELEKLMWDIWLSIEDELKERIPFDPIMELLNSSEAGKLLAPVPQLDIASSAVAGSHYNTNIKDVMDATDKTKVNPVDFEYINAVVESSRVGFANTSKGKILSCRTPDLTITMNRLLTSVVWSESKGKGENRDE
jgi:hypothetical protein